MPPRVLTDVKIVDIQKRKVPSKHYVYVINVSWSDGSVNVVYRRYSKFFDLQTKLLEEFPHESGVKDPSKRILPFLPGKIIFGRSHVRDVALRRKEPIGEYCKDLISLPAKISTSDTVLKFFEPQSEDIDLPPKEKDKKKKEKDSADHISGPVMLEQYVAIADYKKQNRNEVNMVAGDMVEVIDKNENGWWFVNVDEEQGWVPAAYLEREDGSSDEATNQLVTASEERMITTTTYKAELDDEISFEIGVLVTVLEKNFDGWWLIRYQDREGWAPAMYLKKADPSQLEAIRHGSESLAREKAASVASGVQNISKLHGSNKTGTKGRKVPPRKASVKSSMKKLPVHITNMSYEKTMAIGDSPSPKSPEVEYFTVNDFRSLGIEGALNFTEGVSVEVVEKAPNGWWLGKIGGVEGWIPSSYLGKRLLEKQRDLTRRTNRAESSNTSIDIPTSSPCIREKNPEVSAIFVTLADYNDTFEGSISFKEGQTAQLIEQNPDGWSFVRIQGKEGWAPTSYLVSSTGKKSATLTRPVAPVSAKAVVKHIPNIVSSQSGKAVSHAQTQRSKPLPVPVKDATKSAGSSSNSVPNKPDIPAKPQAKTRSKILLQEVPVKPSITKPPIVSVEQKILCKAVESFSSENGEGLSFFKGDEFEFVEDSNNGWWLVKTKSGKEGWVPASYLEKVNKKPVAPSRPAKPNPPKKAQHRDTKTVYVAMAAYADEGDQDCISFKEGDRMEVLEMDEGGWWLVKIGGKSGWAPSNFLKPLE
ncbi:SH3 and PX domain-containing protein 2A-like isoform X2 [Stylophora pistillata]|uniref:SH3 and PX domain-containing protein 2B n=1 Tax=Stylophora pistillata TaxID=50429 RepID=A0A2B4RYC3_STYPI|nr:SH3 and PX domain-containing protein 2A-like isoform X2 [Stylophora pistillata]PFX21799.1 SH3 and PX domain-containing protein 2B [Stylophora pistillata]